MDFERIKWFFEDYWKIIVPSIFGGILVVVLMLNFLTSNKDTGLKEDITKKNLTQKVEFMDKESTNLKEIFSELSTTDIGTEEDYPVLDVSLYLKQPAITEYDLRSALNDYTDLLKLKYNDGTNKRIKAIHYKIYDRKLVYDKQLTPRGEAYYMLNKGKTLEDIEKNKKKKAELESTGINNANDIVWNLTLEAKGNPRYDEYKLKVVNFSEITQTKNINLLTDEEFAYFLKLKMYSKLTGSDVAGARLYLRWDLGRDTNENGLYLITKDFKKFVERETSTGLRIDYFENEYTLKQELALYRPQFLLFALYDELEDDYSTAQKKLIEHDANLYRNIIEEEVNKKAEMIKKDGTLKDEDTDKIKELQEKFKPTIGTDKYGQVGSTLRQKQDTIGDKKSIQEAQEKIEEYKKNNKLDTTSKDSSTSTSGKDYVDTDKEKSSESRE